MVYKIRIKPKAEKALKKIPKKDYYRFLSSLNKLTVNPFVDKKLDGNLNGLYSLRIWPYRIIYTIYKDKLLIIIIKIGHRQGIYK